MAVSHTPASGLGALICVPDLQCEGLARLHAQRGGYSKIQFLGSGAEMTVEDARVLRFPLMPGTRVRFRPENAKPDDAGSTGEITTRSIQRDAAGLLVYGVRTAPGSAEQSLREDAILALVAPSDAVEQLVTVQFNDLRPIPARSTRQAGVEPFAANTAAAREELLSFRDAAFGAARGVLGLTGARVEALPHQVLVAQRALADRQIRFLLADEVGLGKTIEAGLILQSLYALTPAMRVLVIVPGALLSQWFLELYVRFGGRAGLLIDGERLKTYEGNPWADAPLVIASSRAVEELTGTDALRFATATWDAVVVDECHRMQPGGVLYQRIAILSKATPQVLLLSATPARQHPEAYLSLLALLQPRVWSLTDGEAFRARFAAHDAVAALLRETVSSDLAAAGAELRDRWLAVVPGDAVLAAHAAGLAGPAAGRAAAREALIAQVREHHQLDRRVIRNRRAVLARLAHATGIRAFAPTTRSRSLITYTPDAAERAVRSAAESYRRAVVAAAPRGDLPARLAHWLVQVELALSAHPIVLDRMLAMRGTVLDDPTGYADYRARARPGETIAQVLRSDLSEHESATHVAISAACHAELAGEPAVLAELRKANAAWLKQATRKPTARISALIAQLKRFWAEHPAEKVLVFTAESLAVAPIAAALADAFGEDAVATFGAHQDTLAREDAARRFADDDRTPLLVSDPLGGEGRNFQFVSAIAHLDLPWSIAGVEQRIGRVDRLGRDGDVPSWVLIPDPAEHPAAVDAAFAELLDTAVGVFTASTSGLEFIADAIETAAVHAVLARPERKGATVQDGGLGLRAAIPAATQTVAAERAALAASAEDVFQADAAGYAEAGTYAQRLAGICAPPQAVSRWIRGIGGEARRDDDPPHAWSLRARYSQAPAEGVFDRASALSKPQLAFFGLGNELIDRLVADAEGATWARAYAFRRAKGPRPTPWAGVRAVFAFLPDLTPLIAAGLRLTVLRRIFLTALPPRLLLCADESGALVSDPALLALLTPSFSAKNGDAALSSAQNRDVWTRPLGAGQPEKVTSWQDGVRRGATAAMTAATARLDAARAAAIAGLTRQLDTALAGATAVAAAAEARLGPTHADARAARSEADDERTQSTALRACLAGARYELDSLAYVMLV